MAESRAEQCAAFDSQEFMGRLYNWEPFTEGEDAANTGAPLALAPPLSPFFFFFPSLLFALYCPTSLSPSSSGPDERIPTE